MPDLCPEDFSSDRERDSDFFDPKIWPKNLGKTPAGEVTLAGVPVTELLRDFGSPLFVFDEQDVRDRARSVREAFRVACQKYGVESTVYYAGKAFLSTQLAKWTREVGLKIDVCSLGELRCVLASGYSPSDIAFHGNNKSDRELSEAVSHGISCVILDSEEEIFRVAEVAKSFNTVQRVRLRVNSGVHAETHDFLATAHEDQKFGVSRGDAIRMIALIRAESSLDFRGIHGHIGSQIFGTDGFVAAIDRLVEVHAQASIHGEVPELNIGGGFGIAYTSDDSPLDIVSLANRIVDAIHDACVRNNVQMPHVSCEPGRYIVGPAGVTLYTVGTTKNVELDRGQDSQDTNIATATATATATGTAGDVSRFYVSVDGGMSDNARFALYGSLFTARLGNRRSRSPVRLSRVVGMHCESGDIVVDRELLPEDLTRGDILLVAATGAYCFSLASNYNCVPKPAVVSVLDGKSTCMIRAETYEELFARDVGFSGVETPEDASVSPRKLSNKTETRTV